MIGFPVEEELAVQVLDQDPKVKTSKDTLDFPSLDSFLDFDSFSFLGSNRNPEEFSIEDTDFDFFEMGREVTETSQPTEVKPELFGDVSGETRVSPMVEVKPVSNDDAMSEEIGESSVMTEAEPKVCDEGGAEPAKGSEPVVSDNCKPMEGETASVDCATMILDDSELKKTDQGLASSVEVGLEKVSLTMDDDEKNDGDNGKTDSESETSSSASSSSDSSSSEEEESNDEESDDEESDEEENKKEKKSEDQMVMGKKDDVAGELEEGEIESVDEDAVEEDDDDEVSEMVAWSNDEDEDFGLQTKEPIRSKNELKNLPPVPAVDVTLEPHHTTLPVGVVLSVMSTQVIVEGMEKHSPLTEGSILWITEQRVPLGLVDEIFGPVKCPYYIVRFNSESEVPEGISQGTHVSFVVDFAQHILNIKELQKKGYDASGDNDEEISEELEFSDDEKEAEYRRMQKMEKRGMVNDQKNGNARNKKKKDRDLGRHTSRYSGEWTGNQGSSSLSSHRSDSQTGAPVSNLHLRPQMGSFPPNNAGWRPQSNQHNPFQLPPMPNQMGMPNLSQMQIPLMAMQNHNQMMFQPQFNGRPGGLDFFPGQPSAPWPALVGQNCFNQQPLGIQQQPLPNELSFNMLAPQGFQMHQPQSHMHSPQSSMNPQFQIHPQFQMQPQSETGPQSPMNPQFQLQPQFQTRSQFQMQPQSETSPQSQIPQSPTISQPQMQPQSQGLSSGKFSERGRGHRGRGHGHGRGPLGRGRGRGRQQSG